MEEVYVPIDFNAYTIADPQSPTLASHSKETPLTDESQKKEVAGDEKLWRISSLTASVDDETKILILPLPESKRKVKVADTKYGVKSYGDLINKVESMDEELSKADEEDGWLVMMGEIYGPRSLNECARRPCDSVLVC